MDSENQDRCSLGRSEPDETSEGTQKQSKISYARDFLLSLAELDECKNLPSGFDSSLLSQLNDPNNGLSECQRIASNQSLNSSKSSVYSSSQSNHNSDSQQQNVSQCRRPCQKSRYDGILGSAASPRVNGSGSRASAPTAEGAGLNQLNRHKEPYRPLRPFEFVCGLGKGNIDLYNDETFGSDEYLDHETAEEEKRRVSFQLMRKEQENAMQEQKKHNVDEHKGETDPDNILPSKDSKNDTKIVDTIDESEKSLVLPSSTNDSAEVCLSARLPPSRPVIPPGFSNRILEKNLGTKPLAYSPLSEHDDVKAECPGNSMSHSTEFHNLRCEEEKKPVIDILSNKEKIGTQVPGVKTPEVTDHSFPNNFSGVNQLTSKPIIPTSTIATKEISGQAVSCNRPSVTPGVLTCEDLEQSILSGMKENTSSQNHSVKNLSLYAKDDQPNSANDNDSSHFILSLLQNGESLKDLMSVADKFLHPAVDKYCTSTVIDAEDRESSELPIVGELNLIEEIQMGSEQDSTLCSTAGFDEKYASEIEFCLPEEDSLITVDDPIIPQCSKFKPTWNSLESDFTPPVDNIAVQLADLHHILNDERSGIPEGSPFLHPSYGIMSSEMTHYDRCAQKSNPRFQHSWMGPQRPPNYPLHSSQMSSQIRPRDWKNYRPSPQTPYYTSENARDKPFTCSSSENARHKPFTYSCAAPTSFDHPVHHPLLQRMTDTFPVSQPKLNVQRFPQHHQQHSVGRFGTANTAPAVCGKVNTGAFHRHVEMESRAKQRYPFFVDETLNIPIEMLSSSMDRTFNMPTEMERRGRQIHPRTPSGHGQRNHSSKQFDMRFWSGE